MSTGPLVDPFLAVNRGSAHDLRDDFHRSLLAYQLGQNRRSSPEASRRHGTALRRWLGAQAIAIVLVGTLTGVGFWLVGLPSPLALGLIMGLAEFVPWSDRRLQLCLQGRCGLFQREPLRSRERAPP